MTNQQNSATIHLVDKSTNKTEKHQEKQKRKIWRILSWYLRRLRSCWLTDWTARYLRLKRKAEDTFHDLGIDSLDTVDLLMNLEDELGLSIELDEKVETVGQLVELVEKKQQEQQ